MATHGNLWATVNQSMVVAQEHAKVTKVWWRLPSLNEPGPDDYSLHLQPQSGLQHFRSHIPMGSTSFASGDSSFLQHSSFSLDGTSTRL